jgi:hypothetical protein
MSTLKPYFYYLIKKDGVNLSIQQADDTGKIAFSNSVWNSPSRFTVMEDASGGPDSNFTIGDLVIVMQHFGEKTSAPYPKYDYNKDGIVLPVFSEKNRLHGVLLARPGIYAGYFIIIVGAFFSASFTRISWW